MKRALLFAKRNFKEIVRDPLSLIFNFAFPVLMMIVFFCFIFGKSEDEINLQTPMFNPNSIVPALVIFSFAFLTLFGGMLVAKDRTTSFTARLRTSPLKPIEFYIGYTLPLLVIAFGQIVIVYLVGWLFSLATPVVFNLWSLGALLSIVIYIPIALFFISVGVCLGAFINDKAIGGVASINVSLSSITAGMFMPLAIMGVFKVICECLPFYHAVSLAQEAIKLDFPSKVSDFDEIIAYYKAANINAVYNIGDTWWMHLIILFAYTIVAVIASILMFKKKLQSDN